MTHFYILCCRNLIAVKRHLNTLSKADFSIVINTLDSDFKTEAENYCQQENISYYITQSDGTPATGKNSVLDLFLSSDYSHAVLVDGDDFITPHGIWTYKYIANMETPPDALALEYQYGIWRQTGYGGLQYYMEDLTYLGNPYIGCDNKNNPEKIQGFGTRVFLQDKEWWERSLKGQQVYIYPNDEYSKNLSEVHQKWMKYCYKYISEWETHLRVVLFSKKAANLYRYDSDFTIGEDTLMYLNYKDAHVKGTLTLKHLFDRYPTYVYDTRVKGVVEENKDEINSEGILQDDYGWYLWLKKLADKYEQMENEGKLHTNKIDLINDEIVWPENYVPDVQKLVNYPGKQKIIFN